MPNTKEQPSRLELYKAGKLDERHGKRPSQVPIHDVKPDEENLAAAAKLRPELIAIGIFIVVLLALAFVGF